MCEENRGGEVKILLTHTSDNKLKLSIRLINDIYGNRTCYMFVLIRLSDNSHDFVFSFTQIDFY
jgi:hypothetical protein